MDFSFTVVDAAKPAGRNLWHAVNRYADLIHSLLDNRDILTDWRPTLDTAAPMVRLNLNSDFLECGGGSILLKTVGRKDNAWYWQMTLKMDVSMTEMGNVDRRKMDALINSLFAVTDFVRRQNEMYH